MRSLVHTNPRLPFVNTCGRLLKYPLSTVYVGIGVGLRDRVTLRCSAKEKYTH